LEGVSGPMKMSRMKGSVKVRNSQAMMAVKSEGVVARVRMKGPPLVMAGGVVVAMFLTLCMQRQAGRRCDEFCG